jgi:hypothetical protein
MKDTILFTFYFFICAGLGYATLNRYDPLDLQALSDFVQYENIIRNGFVQGGTIEPNVGSRILIPYLAHLLYSLSIPLGTWNMVNFSFLIINAFFTSATALLIYKFSYQLCSLKHVSHVASLLFLLNFFVANSYLSGSIDSGYGFLLLLLTYALYKRRWIFLPLLGFIGCITKEVFWPVGSSIVVGFLAYEYIRSRKIIPINLFYLLLFTLVSFSTILFCNYLQTGTVFLPWALIETLLMSTGGIFSQEPDLPGQVPWSVFAISLAKFFLTLGPLICLGVFSIRKVPENLLLANAFAWVTVIVLAMAIGANGTDYARFMFSSGAFVLCFSSAITIFSKLEPSFSQESDRTNHP